MRTPTNHFSFLRASGLATVAACAGLFLVPAACSTEPSVDGDGSAGAGADGSGGLNGGNLGQGGDGAGLNVNYCGESCGEGEFCSATGRCLPEGSCGDDADCSKGTICDVDSCIPGSECGAEKFEIEEVPPNVMLLLDRSCSMPRCKTYNLPHGAWKDGGGCWNNTDLDKWGVAVNVINNLTANYATQLRWGLALFPDTTGDECSQDDPHVLPGPGTSGQIQKLLTDALDPDDELFPTSQCVTNINGVVEQAVTLEALEDPTRKNYLILLTDGEEVNCGDSSDNNAATVEALETARDAGLPTFVVGFGAGVKAATLNEFAVAGGVTNEADPSRDYFQADNAEQLEAELGGILGSIATCDFKLSKPATSLERLVVFSDEDTLELGKGYEVSDDRTTLTFVGDVCEAIKGDAPPTIDVVFQCPMTDPR